MTLLRPVLDLASITVLFLPHFIPPCQCTFDTSSPIHNVLFSSYHNPLLFLLYSLLVYFSRLLSTPIISYRLSPSFHPCSHRTLRSVWVATLRQDLLTSWAIRSSEMSTGTLWVIHFLFFRLFLLLVLFLFSTFMMFVDVLFFFYLFEKEAMGSAACWLPNRSKSIHIDLRKEKRKLLLDRRRSNLSAS